MSAKDSKIIVGNTLEYLGVWELLYNPDFKPLEFEGPK